MVAGLLGIIAEDPEINRSLIAGRSPDPANAIILASFRSIEDQISDIITLNEIVEDLRVEVKGVPVQDNKHHENLG